IGKGAHMRAMMIVAGVMAIVLVCRAAQPPGAVFSEDFESFDPKRWNVIKNDQTVEIVDGGRSGKCAQVTATLGENTGGYLYKMLPQGLDTAYLRFYVKFEEEHGYTHHFVRLIAY